MSRAQDWSGLLTTVRRQGPSRGQNTPRFGGKRPLTRRSASCAMLLIRASVTDRDRERPPIKGMNGWFSLKLLSCWRMKDCPDTASTSVQVASCRAFSLYSQLNTYLASLISQAWTILGR